MSTAKFRAGRLMTTPAALACLSQDEILSALSRHIAGDWGDCDPEDRAANDSALRDGDRLLSVYHAADRTRFWIITEWDRSATTVLLPEDY